MGWDPDVFYHNGTSVGCGACISIRALGGVSFDRCLKKEAHPRCNRKIACEKIFCQLAPSPVQSAARQAVATHWLLPHIGRSPNHGSKAIRFRPVFHFPVTSSVAGAGEFTQPCGRVPSSYLV